MTTIAYVAIWSVLLPWGLWYLFILVMGLYRANLDKRLTRLTKFLALPALVVGYVVDVVVNWTVACVLFLEPPESPLETVTHRLSRYLKTDTGWRRDRAQWVCEHLLDFFDPRNTHCG